MNGHYIIEYNRASAMVYAVFYAESSLSGYPLLPRDREGRKAHEPLIGYYGGSGVDSVEAGSRQRLSYKL
jgi:hypothetical protein